MKTGSAKPVRCAIYTRVSTDQGLEQDFNSLDAQYDASAAIAGLALLSSAYADGTGFNRTRSRDRDYDSSKIENSKDSGGGT
jgi:DNA invertase Pin-like site-specific DNA recombinase